MSLPRTLAAVDLSADCETSGHVFGSISGSVRHCERFGCSWRDGLDPDDFLTADGDLYDWDDPDRDELGYDGPDAYVLRLPAPSTFSLSVDLGSAAFHPDPSPELARILRYAADAVEWGGEMGSLRDVNGNTCGRWQVTA